MHLLNVHVHNTSFHTHTHTHTHIHMQQQQPQTWAGSVSENTPSQSIVTTDDEAVCPKLPNPQNPAIASSSMGFDYTEAVESSSSLATPPSSVPDDPFASENLGDTVIRLDKVNQKSRYKKISMVLYVACEHQPRLLYTSACGHYNMFLLTANAEK